MRGFNSQSSFEAQYKDAYYLRYADHVHLIATLLKSMTDEKAMQFLKGCSAYTFFKNHPKARLRYPQGHLWSRGGSAVTVGYNQLSDTVKYILEQAKHHGIAC